MTFLTIGLGVGDGIVRIGGGGGTPRGVGKGVPGLAAEVDVARAPGVTGEGREHGGRE